MARAAIVDVDGTLVDTNYLHAVAWARAFRAHDLVLPTWRLHRHVGMGGDKFVGAVAGDAVEERLGDELRDRWEREFDDLLPEVEPLAGAPELLRALHDRGVSVVLASSAIERHLDAFLDVLGARDLVDGWTTSDDVDASKPEPDVVEASLDKAGTRDAALVGDTPWDAQAAHRAGIPAVCLLTGGFAESELVAAGAAKVFESPEQLLSHVHATPFSE